MFGKKMAIAGIAEERLDTLGKYLRRNACIWGDIVAMRQKDLGIWTKCTWKQCYEKSKFFALGLVSLGLSAGDKVCLLGDNEFETYWTQYGVYCVGGTVVGIWVDALPDEILYYLTDSGSRFVVLRDQEQADKLLRIRNQIPEIKKVIWWEPKGMNAPLYKNDPWFISFEQVMELGQQYYKEHPTVLEDSINRVKPDDIANMYYTSGTTGAAKGVARTHFAQIALREAIHAYYPLSVGDRTVCPVGPASIGEPVFGSTCNLMNGVILHFPESPDTAEMDTREVGLCYVLWTPRWWEGIASKIQVRINNADLVKRGLFNLMLPVGYKLADYAIGGDKPSLFWKALHKVGWWLAFKPNLDKAGLVKAKSGWNSGFVLGAHTHRFLRALGLDMREFYGSTELPIIATQRAGEIKLGSLGRPVERVEVRMSDDGEFYMRGPHLFSEYHNKPEKTAQAIDKAGWYHSGDAGHIDYEGNIFYIDRVSEMAQLANGFKYSPQHIEAQMRFGAYIKDCWTVGEDKDFVSAIVTIDFDSVSKWAEREHIPFTTMVVLSQKDEVGKLVAQDILRVNKTLPESVRIKKYAVFHKEFDPDEAELTRTRKLKREYMYAKYGKLAEAIYKEQKSIVAEAAFKYKDGSAGTVSAEIRIRDVEEMKA